MMATHPSASDIDARGQIGNVGWDWASLEPYYQQSKTLQVTSGNIAAASIIDPKLYGTDGPIQISLPYGSEKEITADAAWLQTMKALGLSAKDDPRSGSTLGACTASKLMDKTKG
jgi:choline dehydrogenase-like flavoprotein